MDSLTGCRYVARIVLKGNKWHWQIVKKDCCQEDTVVRKSEVGSFYEEEECRSLQNNLEVISSYPNLEFEDTIDICR